MKKIVFICSHLCSGSSALYDAMNENPRIHGFKQNSLNAYESPFSLVTLTNKTHKMNNASAIYMDELLKNYQFTSKESYSYCNFIYIVRSPEFTITQIINQYKSDPEYAARYYTFRLRRLCEMAQKTNNSILLTYDQLVEGNGIELINDVLGLKTPIQFNPNSLEKYKKNFNTELLGSNLRLKIHDSFERYLYFLKNQSLHRLR